MCSSDVSSFIISAVSVVLTSVIFICNADVQAESNGYVVLSDTEPPGADSQMNEGCEHSSDEEKEAHKEEQQQEAGTLEIHSAALDCSCSRPLLQDSEDEEEQQAALHSSKALTQPSTSFHQPPPSTYTQNHSQHKSDDDTDIFFKGPSRIGPEDAGDVFANAPFPRAALPAQQRLDVFSQAPFGKRNEAAGVQGVTPDQAVFGHVAQQPFRPQALSKYSRHFEGPIPQQPAAAQKAMSDVHSQATAVAPVGPLHSWTSEVSPVDPFISAPFPLKAPQEKP